MKKRKTQEKSGYTVAHSKKKSHGRKNFRKSV